MSIQRGLLLKRVRERRESRSGRRRWGERQSEEDGDEVQLDGDGDRNGEGEGHTQREKTHTRRLNKGEIQMDGRMCAR